MTDLVIDSSAEIGKCGRASCSVTINNVGGEFTPYGSGAYANIDWFSQAIIIYADTTVSDIAFVGMIEKFSIDHKNRLESTVTIQGLDILTFAGSSPVFTPSFAPSSVSIDGWLDGVFDNLGGIPGYRAILLPKVGAPPGNTYSIIDAICVTSSTNKTAIDATKLTSGSRVADWLNTQIFPSGPATCFATSFTSPPGSGQWVWQVYVVDRELNRTGGFERTFTLVDGSATLTSGQLPFASVEVGFQDDELINQVEINDNGGLVVSNASDSTSTGLYGYRAYAATQTASTTQTNQDYAANFWANRYGTVRYRVEKAVLSFGQLKGLAVDDNVALTAFADLCSAYDALWCRVALSYRAPGMSSTRTEQLVITRRRIMASPSDTRIELEFVSGVDNQSFELNSSTYGILDTNRLG